MATLELDGLVKRFGDVTAVGGVSLSVEAGEFCVFVGPSGCGKSTLLRMISGLEPISDGELRIAGKRMNEVGAADRGLAMVFQSYALYPHMSVRQNLSFGLENLRMPRAEIDARVAEAARMLQIEPLLDRKPKALSGGQRQRVAIGRAVVREPTVFLFDEPLSNLDAELRVEMRAELAALHRRVGATMVYVTHDQVEAMTMADRIAVLRGGLLEQFGDPLELYNRPANRFVAGFLGSPRMNFIPARADGDAILLEGGARLSPPAEFDRAAAMELGVRPSDLRVGPAEEGALSLTLTGVEQLGAECYLQGQTPEGAALVAHQPGQTTYRAGEAVGLHIDPATIHLFDAADGRSLRRG